MPQPARILSLLAIEAPVLFQPMTHCFKDFERILSQSSGVSGDYVVRISGLLSGDDINKDQW
jgi:hypothetical protein